MASTGVHAGSYSPITGLEGHLATVQGIAYGMPLQTLSLCSCGVAASKTQCYGLTPRLQVTCSNTHCVELSDATRRTLLDIPRRTAGHTIQSHSGYCPSTAVTCTTPCITSISLPDSPYMLSGGVSVRNQLAASRVSTTVGIPMQ